jgi:hypothetical protein
LSLELSDGLLFHPAGKSVVVSSARLADASAAGLSNAALVADVVVLA